MFCFVISRWWWLKKLQGYYLPTAEIKDYHVVINGRNFFDQPIKSYLKLQHNIRKIALGQGDDYASFYLLDHLYIKEHYKLIAIDLSKQQKIDTDSKANQQINFTGKQEKMQQYFSLLKKRKKQI